MKKKSPLINIITFGLPYKLANQIYKEHSERLKEAKYIIELPNKYQELKKNLSTVDTLLALSIFHKRVIKCLEGADKFYGKITKYSNANTVVIGNYEFDGAERNKILALLINYRKMIAKFRIPESLMDYDLTKEFLAKLITLKYHPNAKSKTKSKDKPDENDQIGNYEDLPF